MTDFKKNMKRLHKEIFQLVQEAEDECLFNSENKYHCPLKTKCPFRDPNNHFMGCMIDRLRIAMREEKHDNL